MKEEKRGGGGGGWRTGREEEERKKKRGLTREKNGNIARNVCRYIIQHTRACR